jgi:hypothetical protein
MLKSFKFTERLPAPTPRPVTPTTTPVKTTPVAVQPAGFAIYQPPTVTVPAKYAGADYTLPLDLAKVAGLEPYQLTASQQKLLTANGFVARPGDANEFFVLYERARYADRPVFVTTDSLLHVYHLMFDKVLRPIVVDLAGRLARGSGGSLCGG